MTARAVMVDTETLASTSNAAIIQLAAVEFDLNTGEWGSSFNAYVSGGFGYCSRSTVLWWMSQPHARALAERVSKLGQPLPDVLTSFTAWLQAPRQAGLPLYAHGAPFDFPVLRASYEACEMVPPWSYRDELDTRAFYRELPDGKPPEVPLPECYAKHDALSDCLLQVAQLVHARRLLGLSKVAA